jgi:SulP family sulfate permease
VKFTFDWIQTLNRRSLSDDLVAGLTGAIIALPQGVAYAMIAGMPPETGLYTAIISAALAALLGSSWHMISGPAAAISMVLMSIVRGIAEPGSAEFVSTILTLTLLTGLIQLAFGLLRLGALVNFISHTVVIGFTAGAAILIAASQLRHLLGVELARGLNLFETLLALSARLDDIHLPSLAIGLTTLCCAWGLRTLNRRLPHLLGGLLIGALLCQLIDGPQQGVAMLGALPSGLPAPALPPLSLSTFGELASGALALALLGLIEAVSIARAIATRSHQQIDGNREFIAQGSANALGSLFSCFAGSGSFTRSGANYDAGARTPLAALFNAAIIALVIFTLPGITAWLPLPAMAGLILLIAWNLIDRAHIRQILRVSRNESLILLTTFGATLLVNPEFSIYAGVLLSIALYLRRTSRPSVIPVAPVPQRARRSIRNIRRYQLRECPQFQIIRIDGSMFFGCVEHIQQHLRALVAQSPGRPFILIIGKGINFIDISAFEMLLQEKARIEARGGRLVFSSFKGTVLDELRRKGLLAQIGEALFFDGAEEAIAAVVPQLSLEICNSCTARIFRECPPPPAQRGATTDDETAAERNAQT